MRGLTVRVVVRISPRMQASLEQQAESWEASISEVIRRCIARHIHTPDAYEYREITLGRNGFQPERAMEYLAARRPMVSDLSAGDHLNLSLRRTIRCHVPELQARRLEKRLRGKTYEEIGAEEGCSKQAAEQAVSRALESMKDNQEFLDALVGLFPDSGLDVTTLMAATEQEVLYATP